MSPNFSKNPRCFHSQQSTFSGFTASERPGDRLDEVYIQFQDLGSATLFVGRLKLLLCGLVCSLVLLFRRLFASFLLLLLLLLLLPLVVVAALVGDGFLCLLGLYQGPPRKYFPKS